MIGKILFTPVSLCLAIEAMDVGPVTARHPTLPEEMRFPAHISWILHHNADLKYPRLALLVEAYFG